MSGSWYLEGSQCLQNIRNYLPNDTASYPTRLESVSEYMFMHYMKFYVLTPPTVKGHGATQSCKQVQMFSGMPPRSYTMEAVIIIFMQLVKFVLIVSMCCFHRLSILMFVPSCARSVDQPSRHVQYSVNMSSQFTRTQKLSPVHSVLENSTPNMPSDVT